MPKRKTKTRKLKGGSRRGPRSTTNNNTNSTASETSSNNEFNTAFFSEPLSLSVSHRAARNEQANRGLAILAGLGNNNNNDSLSPISHHSDENYGVPASTRTYVPSQGSPRASIPLSANNGVRRRLFDSESKHGNDYESDMKVPEDDDFGNPIYTKAQLLHDAVEADDLESVKIMATSPGDLESKNTAGRTLLMTAAEHASLPLLDFLLSEGAALDGQDVYGNTVFTCAALSKTNRFEKLTRLVNTMMARNTRITRLKNTNQSTWKDHLKELLNIADNDGNTPLMYAVMAEDLASVKLLLEHGATTLYANQAGRTPLMEAAKKPSEEGVKILTELLLHEMAVLVQSLDFPNSTKAQPTRTLNAMRRELHFIINYTSPDGATATQIATLMGNEEAARILKHLGGK